MKGKGIGVFLVLAMLLSLCLVTGIPVSAADGANLVGCWQFNENLEDASGNGHDGTAIGDISYELSDRGQALVLTGDSYVSIPDDEDLNFGSGDSFTIEAWVKIEDTVSGDRAIVAKRTNNTLNAPLYMLYTQTGGTVRFYVREDSGHSVYCTSTTAINDGNWHWVAGVRDALSDTVRVYVDDSTYYNELNDPTGDLSSSVPLLIGAQNGYIPQSNWKGSIDEVKIWKGALSEDDLPTAPVPELPTIILFGISIIGIVGYVGYRRLRNSHEGIS